jgi:mRNA interferase MazF
VTRRTVRTSAGSSREKPYIPDRGDVVWIDFNPQRGREQALRRPALVLSPASYNGTVGLAVVCPITNQVTQYPFEVLIPSGHAATGVVLSDQIKSFDWRERRAEFKGTLPPSILHEVVETVMTLLDPGNDDAVETDDH